MLLELKRFTKNLLNKDGFKKDECSSTITYTKTVIEEPTGNVYEAITIMAKERIKSILKLKRIDREIRRVCYYNDSLEEVF
jgi:hypothetical protein